MSAALITGGQDRHLWSTVRWVPVSEAMPDLNDAVIVATLGKRPFSLPGVSVCYFDGTDWQFLDGGKTYQMVTHWCEFPDPPQER